MSKKKDVSSWLHSYNKFENNTISCKQVEECNADELDVAVKPAKLISITSGKGGVGKTSVALKISQLLAEMGKKVLLIDCDYNLSNTHVKLNLPITNHFYELVTAQKEFSQCIHQQGNLHLLAGCNGNLDLFEKGIELDKLVMDIVVEHENEYDYILLDCPAGIGKETLNLNAYSDYRFVIVNPDRSSITDSYSLIKILATKYGIKNNHLILNKVSTLQQYRRVVKIMGETTESFLSVRLSILGGIFKEDEAVDKFDHILLGPEKNAIHKNFERIVQTFLSKTDDNLLFDEESIANFYNNNSGESRLDATITN